MKNRRSFLRKASTAGLALTALPTIPLAVADSFHHSSFFSGTKLRLGFIGLGERGTIHLRNLLGHRQVEIAALCEQDPSKLRNAMRLVTGSNRRKPELFFKGDQAHLDLLLRDDIDAVVISTPAKKHYQIAKDALLAGKHVACELVMGTSIAEHQDILRVSKQTSKQYMSLDPAFFRSDLLAVRRMIQEGVLGEVEELKVGSYHLYQREGSWSPPHANKLKKLEGYGLAMASRLVGGKQPLSVTTTRVSDEEYAYPVMGKKGNHQVAFRKMPMLVSTVDYGNAKVKIQHATESPAGISIGYHLQATKGAYVDVSDSILLDDGTEDYTWSQAQPYLHDYSQRRWAQTGDPDVRMIRGFVDALLSNRQVPVPVEVAAMSGVVPILARQSRALRGVELRFPHFPSVPIMHSVI